MTIFAYVTCLNVREIFSRRICVVVAVGTVIRDIRMVEVRGYPADRRVTVVAIIPTGEVRRVFTDRRNAVMTGTTGAQYLRVVNGEGWSPYVRVVAVLTNIGR